MYLFSYRPSIYEHGPLSLIGNEELPAVSQLDDALFSGDFPGRTFKLEVHVNLGVLSGASNGDLQNNSRKLVEK